MTTGGNILTNHIRIVSTTPSAPCTEALSMKYGHILMTL
jgi:hypothetical protein